MNLVKFNPSKIMKERQKTKEKEKQAIRFHVGDQDQLDIITYAGLSESSNHLKIDGKYLKTIFVSGYPYTASSGWLNQLINFNHNVDISYHIEPVEALLALPKLNRKITELTSTKRAMERDGKIIGSELLDPLESAMELRDKIQRGQENLFQVSLYIMLFADSLVELGKVTKLLETLLATRLFYTKSAAYRQLEALQSVLPRGDNQLAQKRNLDSTSAAMTFPFISSEYVQELSLIHI